jgi:hypothetical protein
VNRRPVDGVSLSFGLLFLGAAVLWLVTRFVTVPAGALGWIVAGGLILVGWAGVVGTLLNNRRRHAGDPDR